MRVLKTCIFVIWKSEWSMADIAIRPRHIGQVWNPPQAVRPRILSVTRSVCAAGYFGRYESAEWILDYSFTPFGRCRIGASSSAWETRATGEAHLYPPRTPYWEDTRAAGVPQTQGIFLSFSGGEAALLPALIGRRLYARYHDPSGRLGELLEQLLEIGLCLGESGFWRAQGVFCGILALLLATKTAAGRSGVIPAGEAGGSQSNFLQKAHAYLYAHLGERIRREQLAAHLHMSVSTLAHRYHVEAGEAPMTTLARMRIHVAKSLLLKGYRLKAIADETGFCDEYHLSKTFRRLAGISPREFCRRQALHPDTPRLHL